MKKPLNKLLVLFASIAALVVPHMTKADTDSTDITISHTYTPYVNLIGTAPGASRFYDNDDIVNFIFPITVNLGTMGLESNVSGDCDLDFTTANGFRLLHMVSGQNLANYEVLYEGQSFSQSANPGLTIPCNTTPTDIDFRILGLSLAGFDFLIPAGVYQDIVTVTVTTQ